MMSLGDEFMVSFSKFSFTRRAETSQFMVHERIT